MSDQPPQQQPYHDDEIDLRKLFQAIAKFFINIGHGIINTILAIRKVTFNYKYYLIVAIILGISTGVLLNKSAKPTYQSSLIIKSAYINAKLIENAVMKLNLLCAEGDRTGLSKVLNVDIKTAENIQAFEVEAFVTEENILELKLMKQRLGLMKIDTNDIDRIFDQIEIANQNTFMISASVLKTDVIDNLEEAVVGYFRNNPYVANRIKSNKARLESLITKLSGDIALLDSLKNAYNLSLKQQRLKSNDVSSMILAERNATDPTKAYTEGVTLFNLLQEAKTDYELGSDFEVLDGFTSFNKPESPGVVKPMLYVAGIMLALAYGFILLIEGNKYLNRVEENGFA